MSRYRERRVIPPERHKWETTDGHRPVSVQPLGGEDTLKGMSIKFDMAHGK